MLERGGKKLFTHGLEALEQGNTDSAEAFFKRAIELNDRPEYWSYLAVCIAKGQGRLELAFNLCEKAMAREPENTLHYLNLGKIYLTAGKKADAIRTFNEGLALGTNQEITEELNKLGIRKPPPFSSLDRDHPANKYLGILLKMLGMR